jgi:hypothetical protein
MISDSQRWMLIVFAAAILSYRLWTAFLVFIALLAESGGKNSQPFLALALLWPVAELAWTWLCRQHDGRIAACLLGPAYQAVRPSFDAVLWLMKRAYSVLGKTMAEQIRWLLTGP